MKGRASNQDVRSFLSNRLRAVAAALIAVGVAACANAQMSESGIFPVEAASGPANTPRLAPNVFDAAPCSILQGCDFNAALTPNGEAPAPSWGDFPCVFLYLVPQGGGNALPLTFAPNVTTSPFLPGTLSPATSSSTRYAAAYFSSPYQFTGGENDAGGRASRSLLEDLTAPDFPLTASAAEPSAVGFALAPFVFAGAALIRRHIKRNRKKK